jgi:hypothetical protein
MGKASSSKKVARAASTGGGRTARGRTPWLWYTSMFGVVVLGTLLIVISRSNVNQAAAEPPTVKDHWHTAYAINICGTVQPNLPQPAKLIGIHTHTDGLIHVEPQNTLDTGKGATLGRFVSGEPGFKLTKTSIQYPGQKRYTNGDKCPDGKPGKVVAKVWDKIDSKGSIVAGDPNNILIKNDRLLTLGFVTDGGASLGQPASRATLPDAAKITGPPSTLPPVGTPTTVAGTATTVPAGPPATAPGTPTTVTPAPSTPASSTPPPTTTP